MTILAGLINLILLKLVVEAIRVNGFQKISHIVKGKFGLIFGGLILILMCLPTIFAISLGMRDFIEVVKMYLLAKTPTEFLLIITILTGVYIVRGGVSSNVKFNEITLWIMFIPMFIVLIFAMKHANYTNILPFRQDGKTYLYALPAAAFSFTGLEVVYIILPQLRNKRRPLRVLKSLFFIVAFT